MGAYWLLVPISPDFCFNATYTQYANATKIDGSLNGYSSIGVCMAVEDNAQSEIYMDAIVSDTYSFVATMRGSGRDYTAADFVRFRLL